MRVLLVLLIAGFGAGGWYLYNELPREFTPKEDWGVFFVITTAPEGTSYGSIVETVEEVEKRLLYLNESGEAMWVSVRAPRGFGNIASFNQGVTIVVLNDWADRRNGWEIMDEVRERVSDIPGVKNALVMRQGLTRGLQKPVQFVIGGPEYEELAVWRDAMLTEIRKNPKIIGVDYDYKETKPQLRVNINQNRAGDLGVSIQNIGRALESLLGSRTVTTFVERGEEYDVIVESDYDRKRTPADLTNIYVRSEVTEELVPLSNLVSLEEVANSGVLNRYNRIRSITIEASLADSYSLGEALNYFDEAAERVVFLVLSAQFESFVQPVTIMLAVPVAVVGGLLGIWFTGLAQNIYTQIGTIMLIGLAAKNGILIVEFINQLREEGRDFDSAVLDGWVRRLRPIIMTGLTTVMGAVPLVITSGAGAETRIFIGVVILFGVALSALFSLIVVPMGYQLLARERKVPGSTSSDWKTPSLRLSSVSPLPFAVLSFRNRLDSRHFGAAVFANGDGLLIGAFDDDFSIGSDERVAGNGDVFGFGAGIDANGGDLVVIGLDHVIRDEVVCGRCVELVAASLVNGNVSVPNCI